MWGFASSGYKRKEGREVGCALLADLVDRTRGWLDLAGASYACIGSDDVLDAVVAALAHERKHMAFTPFRLELPRNGGS